MPWFSGKKKKNATAADEDNEDLSKEKGRDKDHQAQRAGSEKDLSRGKSTSSPLVSQERKSQPSPEKRSPKKSLSSSVREREKGSGSKERPKSPRHSRSFGGTRSRKLSEEHPLNLHPDELKRLSSRMSGPSTPVRENGGGVGEPMETTPAPESVPGGFPSANGVNGASEEDTEGEEAPAPPPHKSPRSPPPQRDEVDAEACKAAGNKFYKAGQYERAIAEYTKGSSCYLTFCMAVGVWMVC